jgi:hypothetical protein
MVSFSVFSLFEVQMYGNKMEMQYYSQEDTYGTI